MKMNMLKITMEMEIIQIILMRMMKENTIISMEMKTIIGIIMIEIILII